MNNNNINTLINEYRNNNNLEAFSQLFKMHERMIYNIIKKVYNIDKEDAYQIACLGFIKAVKTFDTEKDIKFITYATNIIWHDFSNLFKKEERTIKTESYDITYDSDEKEVSILDTLASDANTEKEIIINEEHRILYELIDKYSRKNEKKERIIKLILTEQYTQENIAEIVGSSRSYVAKIWNEFEKYLKTVKIA